MIHGLAMALGWLALVPAGLWMSTVGRSRYPSKWTCYHGTIMLTAVAVILSGAACGYLASDPHFASPHQILGPIMNCLLLLQGLVGIWLYYQRGEVCRCVVKAHRIMGMVVYLGGLVNGALGVHAYSCGFAKEHDRYLLAMALGFVAAVELFLLWTILPVWWCHVRREPEDYEPLEDAAAVAAEAADQV